MTNDTYSAKSSMRRRDLLMSIPAASLVPTSGCSGNLFNFRKHPRSLDILVWNEREMEITAKLSISNDSDVVWERVLSIPANHNVRQDSNLQGTEYTIEVEIYQNSDSPTQTYTQDWRWRRQCAKTSIWIHIYSDYIDTKDPCIGP